MSRAPHWQPGDILLVLNQILEHSNRTRLQPQFLREVLQILVDFAECDLACLVFIERERRFRCEITRDNRRPFRYEESSSIQDIDSGVIWSTGESQPLEQLCRDIIEGHCDGSAPWFTRAGSFWTGDIRFHPQAGLVTPGSTHELGIGVDVDSRAVALIPIETFGERFGLLQLEAAKGGVFSEYAVESYQTLAQTLGLTLVHRRLQLALGERVKELTCLYNLVKLLANPSQVLEELLVAAVKLLPPAWLYPEVTVARIVLDGRATGTPNYRTPVQSLTSDILVHGNRRGFIEVGYTWSKPQLEEGPFLAEERQLVDAVAREFSVIIEQRGDEEERTRLQTQLRHADRLASIGQLAAGVAHELNEPLASVLGFAQLLAKDQSLAPQARQDLDRIISSTLHARDVIRKLLVFARETTPSKSPVDLNHLIEEGMSLLKPRCAQAGIDVHFDPAGDLPLVIADRAQLLQVITNLVVNAVQAMPGGGALRINTMLGQGAVIVVVADTGTGMSPEIQEKIFDPFFTTKDVGQGTGLGLSIVHGIVTSHGGEIDVQSAPDKGSVFTVRLPLAGDSIQRENPPYGYAG